MAAVEYIMCDTRATPDDIYVHQRMANKTSFFVLFAGATTSCARCGYADSCTGFEGTYVYYSQLHCMNARTVMSRGESFELRISCSPPLQELPGVLTHLGQLREFYDPDTVELMSWIMYVELAS